MPRMQGNNVTIGGRTGNFFFVDWSVQSQNPAANQSTIRWDAYFYYDGADAQLDDVDVTVGGVLVLDIPGRVKNFAGTFTTRSHYISGGTVTLGHDNNGNLSVAVSGSIGGSLSGRSSGSAGGIAISGFDRTPTTPSIGTATRNAAGTSVSATAAGGVNNSGPGVTWTLQISTNNVSFSDTASSTTTSGTTLTATGLGKTTSYFFRVKASNSVGTKFSSSTFSSGFPSAPTGLTVNPSSTVSGRIDLSWTAPTTTNNDFLGYTIFRDGAVLTNVGISPTSFANTGLTPGAVHSYYVVARNVSSSAASGSSDASNTVSNITVPGVPGAPTGLTSTPGTNSTDTGKIYLSWTAPTFQNPSITGYDIFRNGTRITPVLNGTATTFVDTSLTPGTSYTYRVQARNAFADSSGLRSADSNTTAAVLAPGVPSIPRNFTATPDGLEAGRINLAWQVPTSINGTITGYDIYRKLSTDANYSSTPTTIINGSTTLAQVYTGLFEGVTYDFKISARNSFADSSGLRSAEATATALAPSLPNEPTSLIGVGDINVAGRVTLSWTAPSAPDGAITGYNVYIKLSSAPSFPSTPSVTTTGTSTTTTILGQSGLPGVPVLVVGTTYDFRVSARNAFADSSGGQSPFSNTVSVISPGLPSAPTLTSVIPSTSAFGRVTLTWEKPSNVGGGVIDYYLYANGLLQTSVTGENTLTGVITGLNPRESYTFTVAARNVFSLASGVAGPQSNGIVAIAPGPPSAPRSLTGTVSELVAGAVTLTWLAPTDTAGGITGYSIYFSDGTLIADTFNAVTSYTVTGLTPAVQYSFFVRARNALSDLVGTQDSAPSNTFTTTARGEPDAPGNVTILSTSAVAGRLTLSWTPPAIGGTIVGYNVFTASGQKVGSTGNTTFVVDNLVGGDSYSFFVRARNTVTDAAGTNGGTASAVVTGVPSSTSLQTLPTPVTVLNETNTTLSGSATITSITSASFSYVKSASNLPLSVVPSNAGSVVNNTNTTINGTYTATTTPSTSSVTYSRVGPNFASTAVPSGSITNETNIIFNGTYEVSEINELTRTVSYEKTNADITTRAVPLSPQATISNTTSSTYNASNISITDVTENTVSYPRTAANIDESPATGVIFNNTNREIYNGTYAVTTVSSYNKFAYSTGDDVTQTNLAKNPSMERVGTGTDVLRTNYYTNPRMSNSTSGWTLLAGGATQTPDVNGTVIDFSDDVAPTTAFFYETNQIPIAVGEYAIASIELTVPPTFPALTLTSTLRSYGSGDAEVQTISIDPGQTIRLTSGSLLTTTASTGVRHLIGTADTISAGSRLVVRNAIFEKSDRLGVYFDGASTDTYGWDYAWTGTADASTSVAKAQAVVIRKNEITNPGFETSLEGELVRTNLFTNPSFEAALTGWTATTGMTATRSTDEFLLGGASLRCVSTATSSEALSPAMSVDASASYTASAFIKGTSGNTVVITIYEFNSSNTQVGSTSSNVISLTGSWQRINVSKNLVATASTVKVAVSDARAANAGQTFFLDNMLFEKSAFLDDYFYGDTPDADGREYAWSGASHASTSTVVTSEVYATNLSVNPSLESVAEGTDILRTNLVNNPAPTTGTGITWAVTDAGISGVYNQQYTVDGFRATTTTQNNDSTFTVRIGNEDGTTNRIPVFAGDFYAFSVTVTSSIADARSAGIDWHDSTGAIISSTTSTRFALTANVARRISVAGLAPAGAVTASLIAAKNGVGGPDATLRTLGSTYTAKNALFEQTDYAGDFFSGDTPNAKGWVYEWTDNANESTSVAKALAVTTRQNILTNPSLETSETGVLLATNYVVNPSMEATSGTTTIRENLATNPAMEGTSGTSNVRENFATNPGMEATGSATTFRENMATNPSFEHATGTVSTPIGTRPAVTGVTAPTASAIAWQESSSALYGTSGIAVEWLKYYGVSSDSGSGLYPFSTSTTPYDLTDTFIDGVYDLHPDNSLTPVSGEDGLYTIGF